MNAKAQSNNFLLMTLQVLLFIAITVFLLSTLAAWAINLPVGTAAAAPALSPTLTIATDSSSPLPTPEPTAVPTMIAPTAIPPADQPTDLPTDQPPNPPANQLSHIIQEGDTLEAIAQAYGEVVLLGKVKNVVVVIV